MEKIKFETLIKGLLSIIFSLFSVTNLTLFNYNNKDTDAMFWVFVAILVSIGAAYGINIIINQTLRK